MVRYLVAFGVSAMIGLVAGGAALKAAEDTGDTTPALMDAVRPKILLPHGLGAPGTRVMSCQVCAGLTCATVEVRGPCTMDKVVEALRHNAAARPEQKGSPHRNRAVSEADYKPLLSGEPEDVGRASAEPRRSPGAGTQAPQPAAGAALPTDLQESESLNARVQVFRPLILDEDEAEDDEAATGEDQGAY